MPSKYLAHAAGCALALVSSFAAAIAPEQILQQVAPSIVMVDISDIYGKPIEQHSGVVIGVGQVVTSCKAIQKDRNLQVWQDGSALKARLQYTDVARDLCQLNVPRLRAPPTILGTTQRLRVGQRVYAVGTAKDQEPDLSEGLVASLRPYEGAQYIHTSAVISPSFRGGGLFDDQGRLVGIATSESIEGRNSSFALPVDWIRELPMAAKTARATPRKESGLDRLNRSIALEKKGSWQGLLKLSQQWTKSEAGNTVAWFSLGVAQTGLKQYDRAIRAYRESIRIRPEYADAWYSLSNAYFNLKQHAQGMHAYQEALRIQPESAEAWRNLGAAYSGLKQPDQGVHAYREPARIQLESADAWYNLGNAYYDLQQYDQAVQAYRESLRIRSENANAWYNLGVTYDELKQRDEAIRAYQEALRIQPQYAMAWYDLGRIYYFQGEREKVREIYHTLRRIDPARADKYFDALILP
ncbi:MAG: tetratricopeptide repeat-containing serine protease family protein [Nitrosospira sp.]|nr:tetratricopeptide repeat-containing serine protease family protein [Nitrosospira sp.]